MTDGAGNLLKAAGWTLRMSDGVGNIQQVSGWRIGTAIYKIENDALMIAYVNAADKPDRVPKDFVGQRGSDTVVLTFTRVKK